MSSIALTLLRYDCFFRHTRLRQSLLRPKRSAASDYRHYLGVAAIGPATKSPARCRARPQDWRQDGSAARPRGPRCTQDRRSDFRRSSRPNRPIQNHARNRTIPVIARWRRLRFDGAAGDLWAGAADVKGDFTFARSALWVGCLNFRLLRSALNNTPQHGAGSKLRFEGRCSHGYRDENSQDRYRDPAA